MHKFWLESYLFLEMIHFKDILRNSWKKCRNLYLSFFCDKFAFNISRHWAISSFYFENNIQKRIYKKKDYIGFVLPSFFWMNSTKMSKNFKLIFYFAINPFFKGVWQMSDAKLSNDTILFFNFFSFGQLTMRIVQFWLTVKPVYNDHPRDPEFVAVVDRW